MGHILREHYIESTELVSGTVLVLRSPKSGLYEPWSRIWPVSAKRHNTTMAMVLTVTRLCPSVIHHSNQSPVMANDIRDYGESNVALQPTANNLEDIVFHHQWVCDWRL